MESKNPDIDSIFEQAQMIQKQKAPQGLLTRIQEAQKQKSVQPISMQWMLAIAAGFLLLAVLNVQTLRQGKTSNEKKSELNELMLPDLNDIYKNS